MGYYDDEEETCDSFHQSLSPHDARVLWSAHGFHSCDAAVAARAVLDGARTRAWDDVDSLMTPQDWVDAYQARHLRTTISDDGVVELVADDTMTAVLMPHALAAWVHDRLGFQAPTLAPPLDQLSTSDWAFLAKPEVIPAKALEELRKVGVTILEPGQRLRLPMTSNRYAEQQSWWHEWPQQYVRYGELLGTPPIMILLNICFGAAHSLYQLNQGLKEIQLFTRQPYYRCGRC